MNIPVIGGVIEFFRELGGKFFELKRVEAQGRIAVAAAKAQAEATVLVKRAESAAEWDKLMAEASNRSWKDEYWTILISLPIPFVFFPETRQWVMEGFDALARVPEWYLWALFASISASFGIRIGILDKLGTVIPGTGAKAAAAKG